MPTLFFTYLLTYIKNTRTKLVAPNIAPALILLLKQTMKCYVYEPKSDSDVNPEKTIHTSLLKQFDKEKEILKIIVTHIFKTHEGVVSILVVDNITAPSNCTIENAGVYQYAYNKEKNCCYIGNTVLWENAEGNNMVNLVHQYVAHFMDCDALLARVTVDKNTWDLPEQYYDRTHFVISRFYKGEPDEEVLGQYVKTQLKIFFERMVEVDKSLKKEKYFIIDKLKEVTGMVGSIAYQVIDDEIHIGNTKLSDPALASTSFYKNVLNDIMSDRLETSQIAVVYLPEEKPYITIKDTSDDKKTVIN